MSLCRSSSRGRSSFTTLPMTAPLPDGGSCRVAPAALLAEAGRALRRKLTASDLEHWLKVLSSAPDAGNIVGFETTSNNNIVSATNGQNVRHQQKSVKELGLD